MSNGLGQLGKLLCPVACSLRYVLSQQRPKCMEGSQLVGLAVWIPAGGIDAPYKNGSARRRNLAGARVARLVDLGFG